MYWILYILIFLVSIIILFILFTIICSFAVNTKKEYNRESRFYRSLLNIWTGIGLRLVRVKISVSGLEKIPSGCNFLVVSNHRSKFDPIVTWYILRKYHIAFVSKEENFHVPFFGRIIRKCCFMPIDRVNPRNALKTIERAAELLKTTNLTIGIYPEGTRNRTEELLLPFHNGVFKIAKKASVPIMVITVKNTEKIAKNYPFHSTKVLFEVLEVIPVKFVTTSSTAEISKWVGKSMRKNLEEP